MLLGFKELRCKRTSPQANKLGVKSYYSNKISHNFKQEGVYFQICVGNLGYYCCFLSGFSVKFAHQNFADNMCYILGHCNRLIRKIRNPSQFFVGFMRVFGSNFKAFKFSIFSNNVFEEDTLARTTLCNEWQKS